MRLLNTLLTPFDPLFKLFRGENPREQLMTIFRALVIPVVGVAVFLLIWQSAANNIDTSLGQFPGPAEVWEQSGNLMAEHREQRDKAVAFYERSGFERQSLLSMSMWLSPTEKA